MYFHSHCFHVANFRKAARRLGYVELKRVDNATEHILKH
jgi:hypothetical protein